MNPDDFEKRLQRVPLREIPSEWREEILSGAEASAGNSKLKTQNPFRLSALLWPNPKAWAGLAALWMVTAAIQFAVSDHAVQVAKKAELPSPEAIVRLKEQTQLFAELVGQKSIRDMDRPKPTTPQPRSDRCNEISFV